MDSKRFDGLSRALSEGTSRRGALGILAGAAGVGLGTAAAKKKNKKCKGCCTPEGQTCTKKKSTCKPQNCLKAPFTIEARWSNTETDHDTYLFVPNQSGANLPSPFVDYGCNPVDSDCQQNLYPFVCVSQDATGPGDEVTTVRQLLPGKYEYWIELDDPSPAGDLTVTLRRTNGTVVRTWVSPANPSEDDQIGWHVFDIDGKTASISSVNQTINDDLPDGAHDPNTDVCPGD